MMKVPLTACRVRAALLTLTVALALAATADAAELCVNMGNSGDQVAGMQVDIVWDPACMTATKSPRMNKYCTEDPSTGKQASSTLPSNSSMRVILFATDNVDPIPDGQLFCCTFSEPRNPCCSLQMGRLIASDSTGVRLNDPNVGFEAALNGVSCATASATEGASRPPAARGPLPRLQQEPVVAEGGTGGGEAPPPPRGQAQPPGQQAAQGAPAVGGGPIGVPPPTSPREQAQAGQPGAAEQPPAAAGEAAAPGAGERARLAEGGQAVAKTPQATPQATAAAAAATATEETPAPPPPATKAQPTKTPTRPAPTATPTKGGGFLSGCQVQK